MEYEINESECVRKDELPRLIHQAFIEYHSGRLNLLLVGDSLRRPAPKFPKNHKKTFSEIKREQEFLNLKKNITNKTKDELIKLYNKDSEIRSLVTLIGICTNCSQNYQCSNYQNYLTSKTII